MNKKRAMTYEHNLLRSTEIFETKAKQKARKKKIKHETLTNKKLEKY